MALKDKWQDLIDGESEVVVEPINDIAHGVIDLENKEINGELAAQRAEKSATRAEEAEAKASEHRFWCYDYANNCERVKNEINEKLGDVGDIGAALDELHAYAQALVNGGAA